MTRAEYAAGRGTGDRRRSLIALPLLLLALCAATAAAQGYPARAVRIVIPHAPAGGTDILARIIAQKLNEATGQPFIVENRAGGNSITGIDMVAKSAPDGYTLLFTTNIITIIPWLHAKPPFGTDDLAPITLTGSTPSLLTTHPSVPVKTLRELVAFAKARPGQLTMAAAGNGTPSHLAGEFFKQTANVDVLIVQYKGTGASLSDLVGGHVSLAFGSLPGLSQLVRAGKVRAIAVTGARRAPSMPEVPALSETYPDFEVLIWYGLFAPARTPREIVNLLHSGTTKALAGEEIRQRLANRGFDQGGATPEQFADIIRRDLARWQKVIARAKIRVE